jgi:purine-cytosine permease-like protein
MPNRSGAMKPPPIGGLPGLNKPIVIHPEDYVKASVLPLVIGAGASLVSILLILLGDFSTWIHLAGYFLTPFLVIICAGLDSVQQRRKATTDLYFVENRKYSLFLRVLSALSLLLSIPHINSIATTISAWVAKL